MVASQDFPVVSRILASNAQWAEDVSRKDPTFFEKMAMGQAPKVLWIGCADSRAPESVLAAAKPGDIFVHRNIANQVHPGDDSVLAVLTYAIDHLGVEHVVVAGHTECGGAAAALQASAAPAPPIPANTPLGRFLTPMIDFVRSLNVADLPKAEALMTVIEENVKQQVKHVAESDILKGAWASGKKIYIHGWVFELDKGKLRDLEVTVGPN